MFIVQFRILNSNFCNESCFVDVIGLVTNVSSEKKYPKACNVTRMIELELTDDKLIPILLNIFMSRFYNYD